MISGRDIKCTKLLPHHFIGNFIDIQDLVLLCYIQEVSYPHLLMLHTIYNLTIKINSASVGMQS